MPSRPLFFTAYLTFSLVGVWFVMNHPASHTTSKVAEAVFTVPHPMHPTTPPIPLRTHYTGFQTFDKVLAVLVSAFLNGAAGIEKDTQVQQANFLLAWTGVLVVWSLEAARTRNAWKVISFTSAWALFYQTVSGAFVAPIYCLIFTITTSSLAYTRQNPSIPNNRARALIPALIFGFILPTLALYYPYSTTNARQIAIAIWQFSPLGVNILWALIPASSRPISTSSIYIFGAVVTALSHLGVIYLCLTDYVNWKSIWVPIIHHDTPYGQAVKFAFQVDYTAIFAATTLLCIYEVLRIQQTVDPKVNTGLAIVGILVGTVVLGPAAAFCLTWRWRETKLLLKRTD